MDGIRKKGRDFKVSRELSIVAAICVLVAIFAIIEPIYFSADNMVDIVEQASINGLLAIGITFVIITGGIDLSVGSTLAIVIVGTGKLLESGFDPVLGFIAGIGMGFILGSFNGFAVTKMKLQPFIATLGAMSIYRGGAYLITGGWPVLNMPDRFRKLIDGYAFNVFPKSILLLLAAALLAYIVLKFTRLGAYLYSMGGNEEATRLSGVNVDFHKIMAYGICGVGAALAGLLMLARLGTGEPTAGQGYELNAIAAVAIGGTSLAGGRGTVIGTLLGALLLQALKVGLVVCGVDTFWQYIATGVIIVIAAYFETAKGSLSYLSKLIFAK